MTAQELQRIVALGTQQGLQNMLRANGAPGMPGVADPGAVDFTIRATSFTNSQNAIVYQRCYGWVATNYSDATVWVNEIPLLARQAPGLIGGFWGFMDNGGGIYKGDIKIVFESSVTDPLLVLVQIMRMS